MKVSKLVMLAYLQCDNEGIRPDEAEVFIKGEDGFNYDIELDYQPESFDGFDEAFPPAIILSPKK